MAIEVSIDYRIHVLLISNSCFFYQLPKDSTFVCDIGCVQCDHIVEAKMNPLQQ